MHIAACCTEALHNFMDRSVRYCKVKHVPLNVLFICSVSKILKIISWSHAFRTHKCFRSFMLESKICTSNARKIKCTVLRIPINQCILCIGSLCRMFFLIYGVYCKLFNEFSV